MGRDDKTTNQEEQGYDADRGNCIDSLRSVRQDPGNEIEEPDRFSQRSYCIDQIDTDEDQCDYNHDTEIR